jgi:hypothetical protein
VKYSVLRDSPDVPFEENRAVRMLFIDAVTDMCAKGLPNRTPPVTASQVRRKIESVNDVTAEFALFADVCNLVNRNL